MATLREVQQALSDRPDYIVCRGQGRHDWKPYTARRNKHLTRIWVTWRCAQCESQKHEQISSMTGERIKKPSNTYPEGYLLTGLGVPTSEARNFLRLQAVLTAFAIEDI